MKIGLTNIVSCKIGSTQVNRVYIGSTLIWSYSAFDPDAQLFITNAAITEPVQQNAVNNLVIDLKGYGIWTKMKAIYPFIGGTASQHKYNLRNPLDTDAAFRLVFNGGGTHSSTGYLPNGVNGYANSFLVPLSNLQLNSNHISAYIRSNTISGGIYGCYNAGAENGLYTNPKFGGGTQESRNNSSVGGNAVSTDSRGLWINTRIVSTQYKIFRNNTINQTSNTSTTGRSGHNAYVGAINANGTPEYQNREVAFSSIGDGLTDTEAANYYTAVQTFQTTLGRQVGVPIVADADAQAFLNAAVIEDVTQANAVNTLVTDLKGYGIWTKMKALYPFVGGTASQHKYNLRNPLDTDAAYRLVFNGGWVHSSTGALPNGTNSWANSFLNPSNKLTLNNTHLSYYSRTQDTSKNGVDMGSDSLSANFALTSYYAALSTGLSVQYIYPEHTAIGYASSTRGFFIGSRINITTNKLYRNTAILGTDSTTQARLLPTSNVGIGANNIAGSPNEYQNHECAFSSIGDGLTDTEAANYYIAVQTFQTTLGRQVGVPIVSDSDAQAFLNAAVITDTTQASAVNTLVTDLKGYGVWTKMKALYPFVGGTAAQHKFNLRNPLDTDAAFRLVFSGGWVHDSNGIKANGTNSYADTKLNYTTLNSGHQSLYSRTTTKETQASFDMGCVGVGYQLLSLYSVADLFLGGFNSEAYPRSAMTNSSGLFINNRTGASTANLWRNGSKLVQSTDAVTNIPNLSNYIGAYQAYTGFASNYASKNYAFSSIGDGLTDTEAANYYTAVQTFQTTLSRNV